MVPKASFNFDRTKANSLSCTILSRTLKFVRSLTVLTVGYSACRCCHFPLAALYRSLQMIFKIYFALKRNACIHDSWPQQQVETCEKNIAASSSSCTVAMIDTIGLALHFKVRPVMPSQPKSIKKSGFDTGNRLPMYRTRKLF